MAGAAQPGDVKVIVAPPGFDDWAGLLALLHAAYAYMAPRIDPPSSLLRMDAAQFERKSRDETLIIATFGDRLVGCAFAAVRDDCVYVGKLAVDASLRGRGIARRIFEAADGIAQAHGKAFLELETRVELTENHRTFGALGFIKIAESAHAGYSRPTTLRMRRAVVER